MDLFDTLHEHPWNDEISKRTFEAILASGWIGETFQIVARVFHESGKALTDPELRRRCEDIGGRENPEGQSTYLRRKRDFQSWGLVVKGEPRVCSVLGKETNTYQLSGELPPKEKPKGRYVELLETIDRVVVGLSMNGESYLSRAEAALLLAKAAKKARKRKGQDK